MHTNTISFQYFLTSKTFVVIFSTMIIILFRRKSCRAPAKLLSRSTTQISALHPIVGNFRDGPKLQVKKLQNDTKHCVHVFFCRLQLKL